MRRHIPIAALAAAILAQAASAFAAELKVYSTIGVQAALEQLTPQIERASGAKLAITWGTAAMLVKRIEGGESADVLVLTREGIDALAKDGKIAPGSAVTFASSGIAVAVKAGAPKPDISTPEAFKHALLSAKTVAYSDPAAGGASGVYFAKLLERMGIAEEMKAKTRHPPAGGNSANLLLTGEAELAVQQKPEVMSMAGTEVVGLLPAELNNTTAYAAAIGAGAADPKAAKALIEMLQSPAAVAVYKAKGIDPSAIDGQDSQDVSWPTKSWPVSTPEEQGMDSAGLARLIETVGTYKQDSLMIVRHGKIVADAYYAPYIAGIRHDLRSVTKSVVSTLTAIELQRGLLDSVDRPVLDLFPDKKISNVDDNKRAMTVQTLLDMTSGIDWQEKAYTPDETIMRMYRSGDRTEFVLNQPMSNTPGSRFYYNSGNPYVLSALITEKTGQSAFDFAKQELFEPLGITSARWGQVDAQGVSDGEAGLFLSPDDMARIGYLYLHQGNWDGRQIIPSSWVERAREGKVSASFGFHYANLWWSLPEKGGYMALGRHSQVILVLPKLDILAVMTGILRDDEHYPMARLIDDVASAVKSDAGLPADPIATSLLAAAIHQAATEIPSSVGGIPELAKEISGKTFQLEENELHVKTFSLNFFNSDSSWVITTSTGKPDHPTDRFSGLMGLDGVYRKSPPAAYGINASKGRWLNERTFALERRILGHSETQTWILRFDADKVTVNFENTDGFKTELHGEISD